MKALVLAVLVSCSFVIAYYAVGLGTLMSLLVQAVVTGALVAAEDRR